MQGPALDHKCRPHWPSRTTPSLQVALHSLVIIHIYFLLRILYRTVPYCTVLYSTLIYSTVASSPIHCTPYSSTTSPDLHVPHPHWLQIYLISSQISYCTVLSCTTDKIMWNTTQLTSYQTLSSTTMSHLVITYVHYRLPL